MRREWFLVPWLVAGAIGLTISCGPTKDPHSPRMRMTPKDIVQQSSGGIVVITAGDDKIGSGFIVDKSGLVATNLHVVASEKQIKVKLFDGSEMLVTQIAGYDPARDLALLRITPPKKSLVPLRLGDSDQMTAGDQIVAIGNPLGIFEFSVSSGLVSQRRTLCMKNEIVTDKDGNKVERKCPPGGFELLQIDAAISQGSSGGPLFNQFGEVIGVTTAIIQGGQSINLAVPTNYLKTLIAQPTVITMDRFAEETSSGRDDGPGDDVKITRMVPKHPITVLDGCSDAQLIEVVQSIMSAIDIGAPLYNEGMKEGTANAKGMEACFRIYEGTSSKLERDPPCTGVGKAFGDGLLRASTMATYKEKAWALRDTFDGMIAVALQRGVKPKP
ncbi:MAG: S1C family serine protease [Kofleriaceae bacterium]